MKYCLLLGTRFEEIEAITIIDLLRRAGIALDVFGVGGKTISGAHQIKVEADMIFLNERDLDISSYSGLLLPGGPGVRELASNQGVLKVIEKFHNEGKLVFAICAAPLLLSKAGILKNKKYTCYPGTEKNIPSAHKMNLPVVKDGNIITAEGIGSAIEAGLSLVETIIGIKEANQLANEIVYHFRKKSD